jgi:hypothetical protein
MSVKPLDRAIFHVVRHVSGWAVEHEGRTFSPSVDFETARAAANRLARAAMDDGRPSQVTVAGEANFLR